MASAQLTQQRVNEFHFTNKISQPGQLKMKTSFSFNVNFVKDNSRCVAIVRQIIRDDEDKINLAVGLSGVFECQGVASDEDKKAIHTQCYDQLFPYIQATVTSLMQTAGIPGFMLRKANMDASNIQVGAPTVGAKPEAPKKQFPIV